MIVYSECNGLTFIYSAKLKHSIPNALDLRQVLNVKVTAINRNGTVVRTKFIICLTVYLL